MAKVRQARKTEQTKAPANAEHVVGKGISMADIRRSTYLPGRPAGVHPRELGITPRH